MKDTYVKVRLTEVEKNLLSKKAETFNMSMSDYIRYCCLVNPPAVNGFEREQEYRTKD